jgi:hypothetical protein
MKLTFLIVALTLFAAHATNLRVAPKKVGKPVDPKADDVVADCVKKLKCENTLMNMQTCIKKAKDAGVVASAEDVSKQFSNCAKERLLAKAAGGDDANPYGPNRKMPNATIRLRDDFLKAKNRTDLNLSKWEAFPEDEEHKVLLTDSVGVNIVDNFKWKETDPDLTLTLVDGQSCTPADAKGDETVTTEPVPFKCQKWCERKANEDLDKPVADRKNFQGCSFERDSSKCTLSVKCELTPSRGFNAGKFKKVYAEKKMNIPIATAFLKVRNALVFNGNSHNVSGKGLSLTSTGHRALVSKPLDLRDGGVISFFMKDGPDNGGERCLKESTALKKGHAEAAEREAEEKARRTQCESKGPEGKGCSGHGSGKYVSSCNSKWYCDKKNGRPFDPTCTCQCNSGYVGKKCEVKLQSGHCRSVGVSGQPATADGYGYNFIDAGEFKYFEHPDSNVEAHVLYRMVNKEVASTSAVAIRVCEHPLSAKDRGKCDTITFEAANCATKGSHKVTVNENGKCVVGNKYGSSYTTKNTKVNFDGHHNLYAPDGTRLHISNTWRQGWWHHKNGAGGCTAGGKCKSANGCGNYGGYMSVWNTIKAPKDGKAKGLCGEFSGSQSKDENDLKKGGARPDKQPSAEFRDSITVKPADSFFTCGDYVDVGYTYSHNMKFKSMAGQLVSAAQRIHAATAPMTGEVNSHLAKAQAEKKCKESNKKTGGAIMTEDALKNCIRDMMIFNSDEIKKNAVQESEGEIEEAFEEAEADEKDEAQELVAERQLLVPGPTDMVLQYCTSGCESSSNWKQLRAFPAKVYADFTENWQEFTARIPAHAMTANTRIRFYQKAHTCYCCNVFALNNIKVTTGGWPVRIIADKKFTLYADGEELGSGEWYEASKDTYRYRVDPKTKVFAVKIEGADEGRMGVVGSFGDSLVTSSSWKCKSGLSIKEIAEFAHPDFDDSQWPSAFEQGQNGMLPWGARPGIAKSAFWIFTSDAYKTKSETAYCRVSTNKAWHSYDKEHLAASRWSCKSMQERQSPYVIPLDGDKMSMVNVANGEDAQTHFSAKATESTSRKGWAENVILLRLKVKKIMEKTVVGEMIKQANLRLYVTDATKRDFQVCRNLNEYSAASVTFDTRPRVQKNDCLTVKADKPNTWANIDISEWIREWVTDPAKHNFGIVIEGQSRDFATFATHLDKDSNKRPRLSLSCHGDRVASEAVFKESKVELKSQQSVHRRK